MSKPPHARAFELLVDENPERLTALIAYALFVDAEYKWASRSTNWPTPAVYQQYHEIQLQDYAVADLFKKAEEVLNEFSDDVVGKQEAAFLQKALEAYKTEAAKSKKGFWSGVLEGIVAAFSWSLLLIAISIILFWFKIDIIEAYKRAAGIP